MGKLSGAGVPARPTEAIFQRRRPALWGAGALFCLLSLLLGPAAIAADLNFAFVGDLTGVRAYEAQDQLDGFRLGIKHLGGRLGGQEFNLTVVDTHENAKVAHQALDRLLQNEKYLLVLMSSQPDIVAALAPVAAASKTFLVSLNAPASGLAGHDCNPYFFSLSGLAETVNDLAGQYLQLQGYHNLVIAGTDNDEEHAAVAAFRRGFKGQVTEILSRHGEMDFDGDFQKIRQAAPEAVYLLHTGGMAVNFIRQFAAVREHEQIPLFGPGTTIDQSLLAAVGPAALDIFSVGAWSDDLDTPANHRLMADFEGDYGRPVSLYAAMGYDGAMLVDAALRAADKKLNDDETLRAALRRVDFPSTRGALRFDTNHFPIQTYMVRQVVEDPRERPVNEQRGVLVRDARDGHAAECPMRWAPDPLPAPKG